MLKSDVSCNTWAPNRCWWISWSVRKKRPAIATSNTLPLLLFQPPKNFMTTSELLLYDSVQSEHFDRIKFFRKSKMFASQVLEDHLGRQNENPGNLSARYQNLLKAITFIPSNTCKLAPRLCLSFDNENSNMNPSLHFYYRCWRINWSARKTRPTS
jgi:hypothetical protein